MTDDRDNEPSNIKIAIMGAGAIGSVIGGLLARKGCRVTLVGKRAHVDEVIKNGLHISGIWGDHTIRDINAVIEPPAEYQDILWNQKLPPTREHRSSMLQDILRGKRTEIDYINGAVVRIGAERGIETPYNKMIVSMVKAKENFGHR